MTCSIKRASKVEVDTFVHIFDSCTQDWFSVASIVEHVLALLRWKTHPSPNFFYVLITPVVITTMSFS